MDKNKIKEKIEKAIIIMMVIALWMIAATDYAGSMSVVSSQENGTRLAEESSKESAAGTEIDEDVSNEYPGIIRFHVIANSDSEEDQELKLAVRDYVLPKIEGEITEILKQGDISERTEAEVIMKYISDNLERIRLWAEGYVRGKGYDYAVETSLGVRAIPAKQYDDLYFPAGNYEALTITIGEGAGQNWWCVVFPPLCLIDSGGADNGGKSDEILGKNANSRIILKSKIKTLLQQRAENTQGM